jgi:hypothetical protein
MRPPYHELPNWLQRLLRYNAMTPDEKYMPEKYDKMSDAKLLNQIHALKEKRTKQLMKINKFLKKLE